MNRSQAAAGKPGDPAGAGDAFGEPVQAGADVVVPVATSVYRLDSANHPGSRITIPLGIFRITPTGTRFTPTPNHYLQLLAAFLLGLLLGAKRKTG